MIVYEHDLHQAKKNISQSFIEDTRFRVKRDNILR